jgi:hypothetical protein
MIRVWLLAVVLILLAGCVSKEEQQMERSFEKVIDKGEQLQKTEKIKIVKNNEVKILLTATYLNGAESLEDEKNRVREKFIIGLYQAGDMNSTGLLNADQNLTINLQYPKTDKKLTKLEKAKRQKGIDRLPLKVQKLSLSDPKLKSVPMVNSWGDYYYVEFPHSKQKQFFLTYQNRVYGTKIVKKKKSIKVKKNTGQVKKDEKSTKKFEIVDEVNVIKYRMGFARKSKYLYKRNVKMFR